MARLRSLRPCRGMTAGLALIMIIGFGALVQRSSVEAHTALTAQELHWTPCHQGLWCATLAVPVDYAEPGAATIDLALIRHRAEDPQRRIGSLVVNFGGPGESGVEGLISFAGERLPAQVRDRFDLVSFDPRGVGRSAPVRDGNDALLPHMSTRNTAHDLELLRAALGAQKLNYLGYSYGTYLGAAYAGLFPGHTGRLVLDSGIDPGVQASLTSVARDETANYERMLDEFIEDCRAGAGCPFRGRTHRQVRGTLETLLTDPEDRKGFLAGLRTHAGHLLRRGVTELSRRGESPTLEQMAAIEQGTLRHWPGRDASAATICADSGDLVDPDDLAGFEDLSPIFGREIALSFTRPPRGCQEPPDPRVENRPGAFTVRDAAPALIIGSTGDPNTPYQWSRGLARRWDGSVLLTVEGDTHTVYGRDIPCVDNAVHTYLLKGSLPGPGTRC
jgi:pimeloyl-ACP methyl ester carboxylesterase